MPSPLIKDADSALQYGAELLRGDRVALRATTQDDIATFAEWWQHGDWDVLQQSIVKPQSPAAISEIFMQRTKNEPPGSVNFSVQNESGTLIGHVTLWGGVLPTRVGTYTIAIGPQFVGQGYGLDATRVLLRYGFDELGLHKIELQVWAFNTRAIRAYEKAGFVTEGIRRAVAFHAGAFHDEVLMGILEEEFRSSSG